MLDFEALKAAPLRQDPFPYLCVTGFLGALSLGEVNRDFPEVPGPGSYPPDRLDVHGGFARLLAELNGAEFQAVMSQKFGLDLSAFPTMFTVRGYCRAADGQIHCDSESKIITVLLYLNPAWEKEGGRLRLLRGPNDLNDMVCEVPPNGGTLLAFRRSDHSWHGHEPYEGQRRAIQMNWVQNRGVVWREQWRHRLSAGVKRLIPSGQGG